MSTFFLCLVTARGKCATGRQVINDWRQTWNGRQHSPTATQFRYAGNQAFGIGVRGCIQYGSGWSFFDDAARIHHRDPVAKLRDQFGHPSAQALTAALKAMNADSDLVS